MKPNEECARLVTLKDHLDMETEGSITPAQRAANDSPPTEVDIKIARLETLIVRKRAIAFLRALDNRLDAFERGEIMPMPEIEKPIPAYLRSHT